MKTAGPRSGAPSLAALVPAALFVLAAWIGWRRWADVVIDFGHELYVPWRLSEGAVLYRDVAHNFGPFSQYLNALIFLVTGPSYGHLLAVNLLLTALGAVGVFHVFRRAFSANVAAAVTAEFILVFAFGSVHPIGGYSMMSPYAHEAVHGFLLSLGMIWGFERWVRSDRPVWLGVAGIFWGCVFLTKAEYSIAATTAAALFVTAVRRSPEWTRRRSWNRTCLAGGAAAPLLAAVGGFAAVLPFASAVPAAAGAWRLLLTRPALAANPYYLWSAGLNDVRGNAAAMLRGALLAGAATTLIYRACVHARRWARPAQALLGAAVIASVLAVWRLEPGRDVRSLPLLTAAALAVFLLGEAQTGDGRISFPVRRLPLLLWAAFSLALLLKIMFFCRFWQYGAFLAMPAALFITAFLLGDLPERLEAQGAAGLLFRFWVAALLVAGFKPYVKASLDHYAQRTFVVGEGGDRLLTFPPQDDPQGSVIGDFLAWAKAHIGPAESLVALPEGAMLNYLARRRSPVKYMGFLPTELLTEGEGRVLAELQRRRPDFVALEERNTSDFGYGPFGEDPAYGRMISDWLERDYTPLVTFGREPFRGRGFGIKVWGRPTRPARPRHD